ncbi:MAG: hypothetical protein KF850_20530 [Labilithrix sp.]|nr:hypothetical protein [Labilithrix sp.]
MRRFTPIELAIGAALLGSIAAVAVPTFARELHASRFVEPIDALARMSQNAAAQAEATRRFGDSAPLTPSAPPRGTKEVTPTEAWEHPAWLAIDFRPVNDGAPHAYAYAFDSRGDAFTARAHGDLDGDGIFSTFEVHGLVPVDGPPRVEPGMYVESELE